MLMEVKRLYPAIKLKYLKNDEKTEKSTTAHLKNKRKK